ncbi:hypothetical protein ILUMI_18775, partial [Ignelater luminosus]
MIRIFLTFWILFLRGCAAQECNFDFDSQKMRCSFLNSIQEAKTEIQDELVSNFAEISDIESLRLNKCKLNNLMLSSLSISPNLREIHIQHSDLRTLLSEVPRKLLQVETLVEIRTFTEESGK